MHQGSTHPIRGALRFAFDAFGRSSPTATDLGADAEYVHSGNLGGMTSDHRIPFACGPDGRVMSIQEVPRGLDCQCTCPACEAPLVAKKGRRQAWHFSHAPGTSCAGALESALHIAVKQIIEEAKGLRVPTCTVVRFPEEHLNRLTRIRTGFVAPPYCYSDMPDGWVERVGAGRASSRGQDVEFDAVLVEHQEGDIRPDLVAIKGNRRLYIEVAVTHFIDDEKLRRIRARKTAAIEIVVPYTLNETVSWDRLRQLVLVETKCKHWAYHPRVEHLADQDYRAKEPMRLAAKRAAERAKKRAEETERRYKEAEREREEAEARVLELVAKARSERETEERRCLEEIRHRQQQEEIARAAAEREALARERREAEELAARRAAERAARFERLRAGVMSPEHPLESPVLLLDLDGVLQPDSPRWPRSLAFFQQALIGLPCSIVITSSSRHTLGLPAVAQMLAPLGGRHLGATPVIDANEPYGIRSREIAKWLGSHPSIRPLIVNAGKCGGWPGWQIQVILPQHGFQQGDADYVRRWVQANQ